MFRIETFQYHFEFFYRVFDNIFVKYNQLKFVNFRIFSNFNSKGNFCLKLLHILFLSVWMSFSVHLHKEIPSLLYRNFAIKQDKTGYFEVLVQCNAPRFSASSISHLNVNGVWRYRTFFLFNTNEMQTMNVTFAVIRQRPLAFYRENNVYYIYF